MVAGDRAAALLFAHVLVRLDRASEAIDVLRPLAEGVPTTAEWLIQLLTKEQRLDEVIDILRAQAVKGNEDAAKSLADLLDQRTRPDTERKMVESMVDLFVRPELLDELATRAEAGGAAAAALLAEVRVAQGKGNEAVAILQAQADRGDQGAADELSRLEAVWDDAEAEHGRLRDRADAGDNDAAEILATFRTERGRLDRARERAAAGDRQAAEELAGPLISRRQMAALQARVDAGDRDAITKLVGIRAGQNRLDEAIELLRRVVDSGDQHLAQWLNTLLVYQGNVEGLRARTQAGDANAGSSLVKILKDQGRVEEAIDVLRARADAGDRAAAEHLPYLLAEHNRLDELRVRADAGEYVAAARLLDVLVRRSQTDQLMAEVNAGTLGAAERWINELGDDELADHIRRFGLPMPEPVRE